MFWYFGTPYSIVDLSQLRAKLDATRLRQVKIALIDDEPFPYLETLRRHDFIIKQLSDITDVHAVESYDVVMCDIRGVGKHFQSPLEGAHVIMEIRKFYPWKTLLAYSGQQFDPSFNKAFAACDFMMRKDTDSDEWIETLDRAAAIALDPAERWKRVRNVLIERHVPLITIVELEHSYVGSVLNHKAWHPKSAVTSKLPEDARAVVNNLVSSSIFTLASAVLA